MNNVEKNKTESEHTMIPSLPEIISATHVEYLPLSATYLRPIIDVSRSRDLMETNNAGPISLEYFGSRVISKEERAKMRGLRKIQQCNPINISAVPRNVNISYFRGSDLCYAPYIKVPAAESMYNF